MAVKRRGLGKGLDTLIPNKTGAAPEGVQNANPAEAGADMIKELPLKEVEPNRAQPRKNFDSEALEQLAASIKEHGVITPILVQKEEGYYQIIAGERRWRAARIAGLETIPAIVKNYGGEEKLAVSLIADVDSRSTIADMTISYEVQGIINSRYQDPALCLSSIAQELQRSPNYISKVFKAETGRSLVDYINEIRIAKAKELLREKNHVPQETIAEQVGISNIRTFQRLFKKMEGITPGQYRDSFEAKQ